MFDVYRSLIFRYFLNYLIRHVKIKEVYKNERLGEEIGRIGEDCVCMCVCVYIYIYTYICLTYLLSHTYICA